MTDEQHFHIGIKALIINKKNETLLLKANPDVVKQKIEHWDLPGGRINEGDSVEATLKREMKEELDIGENDFRIGKLFDASISKFKIPLDNGHKVGLMLMTYVCSLKTDKKFSLSKEHTEHQWFSLSEAKRLLSVKFSPEFIRKLDDLKKH